MSLRVDVKPGDLVDIHHVGLALNTMLESLNASNRELQQWSNELETKVRVKSEDIARSQNEIYQIDRLASLGRLSSSVAHEINNPLLVILGRIDMLAMDGEKMSPGVGKTIDIITSQAKRMRVIVDRLLLYSRKKPVSRNIVDVNEILKTIPPLVAYYPEFQ